MQYIFEKVCYYYGREKINKNGEKLKAKDLIEKEDKENSTKKNAHSSGVLCSPHSFPLYNQINVNRR